MTTLPQVNPGDLITAKNWNDLVTAVQDLDAKVTELLGKTGTNQGQVSITQVKPSDQIHRGEELQILGVNFYWSIGASRVSINGQPIQIKQTSNESQLNVDIPISFSLGPAILVVSNSVTSAVYNLTILEQALPLNNNIDVTWLDVNPQRITTGSTQLYKFHYQIVSHTNRKAIYTFNPVISITAWQQDFKILDDSSTKMSKGQLELAPEQPPVDFYVQGILSDKLSLTDPFTLRIDVTAEGRSWSQGDHSFHESELVLPADSNIELEAPTFTPTTIFDDPTNTVLLPTAGGAILNWEIRFKAPGTYNLVIDSANLAGWKVEPADLLTQKQYILNQNDINNAAGSYPVQIKLKLTAPAASSQTSVSIGFQNAATPNSQTVEYFILHSK